MSKQTLTLRIRHTHTETDTHTERDTLIERDTHTQSQNTLRETHMQRDTHRDTQRGKLPGKHIFRDIHVQWEKHTLLRENQHKH